MEPSEIKRLDQAVVNKIAAGEIIQRPANALKEMIENSIDAKSTNIQVVTKSGGLKFLQIQDNGTGIRKDNFEIVCERFTTSKLEKFEDLTTIATYGFRGEALASISHVAHLTIQSKTAKEKCAFKASFEDSHLKGTIKPCAGNQGTIITVEDLFYNVPQRKQVLKTPNEEFQRIFEVVSRYAIHNSNIGFVLKKFGEPNAIRTLPNSNHIDNIRLIYGNPIAKELLEVELKDNVLQFVMKALITNVNYSSKKSTYLMFINHRLVESLTIKAALDQIYSTYLPRGSHPFVYISLELEPRNVDVNVHPTKHEVHFLHEEDIVEKIKESIEKKLLGSNESRTFYTQSRLPGASEPLNISDNFDKNKSLDKTYAKDMVRTDPKIQKLDKFLGYTQVTSEEIDGETVENSIQILPSTSFSSSSKKAAKKRRTETNLTSILELRTSLESNCQTELRKIMAELVFVGVVNRKQAVIQYQTQMYLCSTEKLSEELFYQIILYDFENFSLIKIEESLCVKKLALLALDTDECGWTEEDGSKEELADKVREILIEKSQLMKEYFGVYVSDDGQLTHLPLLLENYQPSLAFLPMYILRLSTEVEWDSEIKCFQTFARETAIFYSQISSTIPDNQWKWTVEFVLYPEFRKCLLPPKSFSWNKCLLQVASLSNLYKVFERC